MTVGLIFVSLRNNIFKLVKIGVISSYNLEYSIFIDIYGIIHSKQHIIIGYVPIKSLFEKYYSKRHKNIPTVKK